MLKKMSLKTLELALNTALHLDPDSAKKLSPLDNKVLQLIITPLNVHFFILFSSHGLQLLATYAGRVDTIIHSSPIGLIRLSLLPASKARSLFNDSIHMSGDVELGQHIKQLFDNLDIDWEGHLAYFTGDVIAWQIGSLVRQGLQFNKQYRDSMTLNVREFLQEELQVTPCKAELNDFYKEIDQLILDVDRIEAHLTRLKKGL